MIQQEESRKDIIVRYVANDLENQTCLSQGWTEGTSHSQRQRATANAPMDPLTVGTSLITIFGASVATASTAKALGSSYKHAEREALVVHRQKEQAKISYALLKRLPTTTQEHLLDLDSSLIDLDATLPSHPRRWRKRDKIHWATKEKSRAETSVANHKDIASSVSLTLNLEITKKL
jgi:hypothetical protein